MLFYPDRISPYLLFIPVIAAVQFVFTLACAFLVAAGNVFFRDLGNVVGARPAPVVVPVARAVQPGRPRRASHLSEQYPILRDAGRAEPVRDPVRGLPDGHLRDAGRRSPRPARTWRRSRVLLVGSIVFLASTTIVFKRLEPNFAKVL